MSKPCTAPSTLPAQGGAACSPQEQDSKSKGFKSKRKHRESTSFPYAVPALEVTDDRASRTMLYEKDSHAVIENRRSKYPNYSQSSVTSRCIAHCKLSISLDARNKLQSLGEIGQRELTVFQACSSGPAAFFPKELTCVDMIPSSYYNKYVFPILRPVVVLVESKISGSQNETSLRQVLESSGRLALLQLRSLAVQTCFMHQKASCNICWHEILAVTAGSSAIVQKEFRDGIPDFDPDCLVGIFVQYR
eukprot:758797-Hanusia_phi.AAC.5